MKILFDHQTFNYQNYGGISRYFTEIISGLRKKYAANVDLQLIYSHNEHLQEKQLHPTKPYLKNIKGSWRLQNLLTAYNKFVVKRKLSKGVDIFHPTYFDTYYLNSLGKTKFVLTIYDMIHEKKIQVTNQNQATAQLIADKKQLALAASRIIAISESTKKDIIDLYGIDSEKIEVIYLSGSLQQNPQFQPDKKLPKKYILFVGNRRGYKNFQLFTKAIVPLLASDTELNVVCAGGGKFSAEEQAFFEELNISKQLVQLNINDDLLAYLYQHAVCFVFPSLYEGFGIPTLEAFSCGCPVVLSNVSSMPEVGGDAVVYIDPENEESIYEGVKMIIENRSLRDELIQKGYRQAEKFSWEKCVDDHYHLYHKLFLNK